MDHPRQFSVITPSRTYYLRVKDREKRDMWVKAIQVPPSAPSSPFRHLRQLVHRNQGNFYHHSFRCHASASLLLSPFARPCCSTSIALLAVHPGMAAEQSFKALMEYRAMAVPPLHAVMYSNAKACGHMAPGNINCCQDYLKSQSDHMHGLRLQSHRQVVTVGFQLLFLGSKPMHSPLRQPSDLT